MKSKKKIEIKPIWVEFIPKILIENNIYISIKYQTAVHKCLCGCGNLSVTPLSRGQWFLTDVENKITLTPSILNRNCPNEAHYVINNNIATLF